MASPDDDEDAGLRSAALQNVQAVLLARQRAEDALRAANRALQLRTAELAASVATVRATLEATTDGILVSDGVNPVAEFNRQFVEMWRVPDYIIESRDRLALLEFTKQQTKDPDAFVARIAEIHASGSEQSFDLLALVDGRVFERFSRIRFVDGRQTGRVWSFRDISGREQLLESERAARAEAERMSALKDEFLATLSHELRTPLSAILGWSQVLRLRPDDGATVKEGLHTIERNARVQIKLIEDLLDMSRIISGKLRLDVQSVDPLAVVEEAIATSTPAAQAKGVRIERQLDPACGAISGDPNRLQQVVWNLLANAVKFTPKGGKVQVRLERVNSHIEVSVADTGVGIRPEFLPHVFERFRQDDASTTRRFGGLGLGLSIVKHLVELHGGTVHVASPGPDLGTTFTVRLPLKILHDRGDGAKRLHPRTEPARSFDLDLPDLQGLKVLVIDDEPDARELVKRVLVECNIDVVTADDAQTAVRQVREHRPDVIVSDISMPDVDGFALLKLIRALGPDQGGGAPVIALTAFARSEDRTRALNAGFLVHVSKPVEPAELIATVATVAGRTGQR